MPGVFASCRPNYCIIASLALRHKKVARKLAAQARKLGVPQSDIADLMNQKGAEMISCAHAQGAIKSEAGNEIR